MRLRWMMGIAHKVRMGLESRTGNNALTRNETYIFASHIPRWCWWWLDAVQNFKLFRAEY